MTKTPPDCITAVIVTAVFIDDGYIVGLEPDSFMQFFTDEDIRKRTKFGRRMSYERTWRNNTPGSQKGA